MITLFTCPRAFEGHTGIIQHNALDSWKHLTPAVQLGLLGNEAGVERVAKEFQAQRAPVLDHDAYGTPLVNSIFEAGEALATDNLLAYVNADILLFDDFMQALVQVEAAFPGPFLMIGQRIDLDVHTRLDFEAGEGDAIRDYARTDGKLHQTAGIDYFAYRRGTWDDIPPFALGRWRWDNWLVWDALDRGVPVIDATRVVLAVHQNHDHAHHGNVGVLQRQYNDYLVRFSGGRLRRIEDATHVFAPDGTIITRKPA